MTSRVDITGNGTGYIDVSDGSIDEVYHVHVRSTGESPCTRLEVTVGRDARVTIVEEITGDATSMEHSVEIRGGERSVIHFISLQRFNGGSASITQHGVTEGEGSITWHNASLGSAALTHDLESRVTGEGGTSSIDWLLYGKSTEHHKLSVHNMFDAPEGRGEVTMKAVAEQQAHAVCRGMIHIGLPGRGTNTYLTQEVLMLDPTAKVDAVPGLEIKTNDVKASHSATVSRVTPADLFYFASRGITEREARRMFVMGFLGSLTDRIPDAALRGVITDAIEARYDSSIPEGTHKMASQSQY